MITILTSIFVILQILDGWTTWKILSQGGRELNPKMVWLMDKIGVLSALVLSKALLCIGFAFVSWKYPVLVWLITLIGVNGFCFRVVWNNWNEIKQ